MAISFSNNSYTNTDYRMSEAQAGQSVSYDVFGGMSKVARENTLPELSLGSTISGEVVSKDGENVTLRLPGNQMIEAKLTGNAQISVGQKISFEVSAGGNNQLALRPLFSNLANNPAAVSALRAASLPVNNSTIAMTDRMMLEGMSINKNALTDMFKSVSMHQNVSVETVVQMNKLGMPLTEDNLVQFENYRNFEHRITSDILDLAKGVSETFSESLSAIGHEGNIQILSDVLDIADNGVQTVVPNDKLTEGLKEIASLVSADDEISSYNLKSIADSISGSMQNSASDFIRFVSALVSEYENELISPIENKAQPAEDINPSDVKLQDAAAQEGADASLKESALPKGAQVEIAENKGIPTEYHVKVGDKVDIETDRGSQNVIAPDRGYQGDNIAGRSIQTLNVANSGVFTANISKEGTITANILNGSKLLDTVNEAEEDTLDISIREKIGEKLAKLLKSDDFKGLIKDTIKAGMTLEPKEIAQEGKIEELYERILKTAGKINRLMENLGQSDSVTAKAATNISDNVTFINNLNEFVNYVQLPLAMTGQNANGELYVYTKKKNLKENGGNFSALLHLDMEYLGPMDVYVTMRDYTKINTNFCLASEELLDFVESHIDELTKRLTQKGYDVGIKTSKKEDGEQFIPIADEFTKNEEGNFAGTVSKLCFDVRA